LVIGHHVLVHHVKRGQGADDFATLEPSINYDQKFIVSSMDVDIEKNHILVGDNLKSVKVMDYS
jgi:hypothetical protein